MSLKPQNIASFDRLIKIQSPTTVSTSGQQITTWADEYTDVPAREERPMRGAGEKMEDNQAVAIGKRSWSIRKIDRTVTAQMRVVFEGENWYITNVHPYGTDRLTIVLECESRDND